MFRSQLTLHERLASLAIIQFFSLLTLYILFNSTPEIKTKLATPPPTKTITIAIQGAVWYPGLYELPQGETLQTVIDLAIPFPEANTDSMKMATKLTRSRKILVKNRAFRKKVNTAENKPLRKRKRS
jgi:hypothetical protein